MDKGGIFKSVSRGGGTEQPGLCCEMQSFKATKRLVRPDLFICEPLNFHRQISTQCPPWAKWFRSVRNAENRTNNHSKAAEVSHTKTAGAALWLRHFVIVLAFHASLERSLIFVHIHILCEDREIKTFHLCQMWHQICTFQITCLHFQQ